MATHVNIGEAKTRLSELVAAAVRGEEVILNKAGAPQVRLVPVEEERRLSAMRGRNVGGLRSGCSGIWSATVTSISARSRKKIPNFKRRIGANMAILIDTQALAWLATGDSRLSRVAADALLDESSQLLVSAVTAYEFADLNRRGRFDADLPLRRC